MKTIWIVGKHIARCGDGSVAWEFEGAFDTQEKAEAACTLWEHFVGPAPLNALVGDGIWPGCYYPLAVKEGMQARPYEDYHHDM